MERTDHTPKELKVLILMKDLRIGNGIAACIMNYYDGLVAHRIHVDFLVYLPSKSEHTAKASKYGTIYQMPQSKLKWSEKRKRYVKELLKQQQYDIIHVNLPGPMGAGVMKLARQCGVPVRIYHCHNPLNANTLKRKISIGLFTPVCIQNANHYMSCSRSAGLSVFKHSDFTVLRNCIDFQKFVYDASARAAVRQQLGISENTPLIGTVGRFEDQKNPLFALDCIRECIKLSPDLHYVWVGAGSMEKEVRQYIEAHQLSDHVTLAGTQINISDWYSAMDLFLLPSKFEGLGIVFIEAQAAGLPVFGSDMVPEDTDITPQMHRLPLSASAAQWADSMHRALQESKNRIPDPQLIASSGYDIKKEINQLAEYYLRFSAEEIKN